MLVVLSFFSNTAFNFVIGLLLARFLGPADYGRFALTLAIAVVIQTVAFDWARVATSRFLSVRIRDKEPRVQGTIDGLLVLLILATAAAGLLIVASPLALPLSRALAGLAVLTAIVNGIYDYSTAKVRALFQDHAYSRLIIGKNLLASVLTLGGAYVFGSAEMTLLGVCLSMAGALLIVARPSRSGPQTMGWPDRILVSRIVRYALPIVAANLIYQTIPLADRLLIADAHGFAESGQFSLAYDIGIRIVAAVGSALDALLFQLAVRADETHGVVGGRRQAGMNCGVVFALLLPACVGCWLVLPSIELLVVPAEFRGAFVRNLRLLLPGLFCFGMITFAIQPLLQIEKRTAPLIVVALMASAANLIFISTFPASRDATSYAAAQGAALSLALAVLTVWAFATTRAWPRVRDIGGVILGSVLMAAAIRAVHRIEPGIASLIINIAVGVSTYAFVALVMDLCDLRTIVRDGRFVARLTQGAGFRLR